MPSSREHSDRSNDAPTRGGGRSPSEDSELFRGEAVEDYYKARDAEGDLIRISPRWERKVYWFLMAAVIGTLLFGIFGRRHEYASGPAIVSLSGQTEITAHNSGTVEAVEVIPGSQVSEGQVLVQFHADIEQDLLDKLETDFEIELIRLLRNPEDQSARAALARIRAEMSLARAQVEERLVRAPHDGFVHDLRTLPGQLLTAGDPILSIVRHSRSHELIAFLPGQYRPLLAPGQNLRLEITGYAHAYVDLTVRSVGDQVIGPSEARRFLGPEVGDALPISGPVILVRAEILSTTFDSAGRRHSYFSGMQGLAEVSVRDESLLVALVPGIRALLEKRRG